MSQWENQIIAFDKTLQSTNLYQRFCSRMSIKMFVGKSNLTNCREAAFSTLRSETCERTLDRWINFQKKSSKIRLFELHTEFWWRGNYDTIRPDWRRGWASRFLHVGPIILTPCPLTIGDRLRYKILLVAPQKLCENFYTWHNSHDRKTIVIHPIRVRNCANKLQLIFNFLPFTA